MGAEGTAIGAKGIEQNVIAIGAEGIAMGAEGVALRIISRRQLQWSRREQNVKRKGSLREQMGTL